MSKHSISPYPEYIKVSGDNVFVRGKFVGYVDRIKNWGDDFLARSETGLPNKYFNTKTKAVFYLAGEPIPQ